MSALPTPLRRASLGLVTAAMLIGALLWIRWSTFDGDNRLHLDVYRQGGLAILRGEPREPLYSVRVRDLRFTYPPFAATLFTRLSRMPVEIARWMFTAGSLACYVALSVLWTRSARIGWLRGELWGTAGLTLEPFFTTIDLGQIKLYLILMVTLDCLVLPARHRGWLVGLAAGVKIVPGVFVLYFVLQRDWPAVRRAVAGFAISVLGGALLAPGDSWRYWSAGSWT